jgi:hypothetical protein
MHLSDKPGYVDNWLDIVAQSQPIQPPAIVVKRHVYETVGSFFGMHYGEDWEMWVRISSRFPVVHSPRRLASYRVHTSNISSQYFLSGQNVKDICKVIDIVQDYLPEQKRKILKRQARRNFSMYFARTTDLVYSVYRNPRQALRQAVAALTMHVNRVSLFYMLKIAIKVALRYKFK